MPVSYTYFCKVYVNDSRLFSLREINAYGISQEKPDKIFIKKIQRITMTYNEG